MLPDLVFAIAIVGAAYGLWRLARPRMEKIKPAAWRWLCMVIFACVLGSVLERVYREFFSGQGTLNGYIGIGITAAFVADECYSYAVGLTEGGDTTANMDNTGGAGNEKAETSGEDCYARDMER